MNTFLNKSINTYEEFENIIKIIYPNCLTVRDYQAIIIQFNNDKIKYSVWVKKPNLFEVVPVKAIWNRTFEMKAKAQEIAAKIKEFIENGSSVESSNCEIPDNCPSCKSPNSKKTSACEWCGNQII